MIIVIAGKTVKGPVTVDIANSENTESVPDGPSGERSTPS